MPAANQISTQVTFIPLICGKSSKSSDTNLGLCEYFGSMQVEQPDLNPNP